MTSLFTNPSSTMSPSTCAAKCAWGSRNHSKIEDVVHWPKRIKQWTMYVETKTENRDCQCVIQGAIGLQSVRFQRNSAGDEAHLSPTGMYSGFGGFLRRPLQARQIPVIISPSDARPRLDAMRQSGALPKATCRYRPRTLISAACSSGPKSASIARLKSVAAKAGTSSFIPASRA